MDEQVTVETFAHGLSDRMLACRELGHAWVPWAVEVIDGPRRRSVAGYLRTMRCKQCRTQRNQLLDSSGAVIRNGYQYRDGYLANGVQSGFTRDTFRLESVHRWLDRHPLGEDEQTTRADASVYKLDDRRVS